jgi:hypothetical protein
MKSPSPVTATLAAVCIFKQHWSTKFRPLAQKQAISKFQRKNWPRGKV